MSLTHRNVQAGDHVFLVDGSNFVFRAYFQSIRQDQKYNYRTDRLPTGAVRLFCTKLFQFIREGAVELLVMGAYGHNRFRELMVGSTTSSIIRKSPIPVLLTR